MYVLLKKKKKTKMIEKERRERNRMKGNECASEKEIE